MSLKSAFENPQPIQTKRFELQLVQLSDAPDLHKIKSNPAVVSRYAQPPHESLNETRSWVHKLGTLYDQQNSMFWCARFRGTERIIGSSSLWGINHEAMIAELGFELDPEYWHQGIMTEVATAIVDYGFNIIQFQQINALALSDNIPSQALLRRLGFADSPADNRKAEFNGQPLEWVGFTLLPDEWATQNLNKTS